MIATAFAVPVNFERFGSLFRLLSGTAGNKSENYAGSQLIRTQHWLLPSFWRSHPLRRRRHDAADSRLIRQPRCKRPRRRSPARAAGVERHLVDCRRGRQVYHDGASLARQHGVDRHRKHIVIVEHTAGFVHHREPVAVGILSEADGGWSQTATSVPRSGRCLAYTYVFSPLINTSRLLPIQGTSRAKDGRNAA